MNHQISKNTKPLFKNRKICKIIVQLSLIMFWKSYFLFFKDNSKPCRHVPFVWRRWQSVRVLYKNQRHWPSTLRTWPSQDSQIGVGLDRWTLCVDAETKTAVSARNRLRRLRTKNLAGVYMFIWVAFACNFEIKWAMCAINWYLNVNIFIIYL